MDRRTFVSTAASIGLASTAGCLGYTVVEEDELEQLEQRSEKADELEVVVQDQESRISNLENELSSVESDLSRAESRLESLREETNEQQTEIEDLNTEIENLEREVETLEDQKSELQETIDAIEPERTIPDDDIETAAELAEELREQVVQVYSSDSRGTGFYIGEEEYLTAEHIVNTGAFDLFPTKTLEFISGSRSEFEEEESDPDIDTALLSSTSTPSESPEFGSIESVSSGETLFSIGHPFNVGYWICSVGQFEQEASSDNLDELYRSSVPARSGSSGSPIFNLDGEVVGLQVVNLAKDDLYEAPDEAFTNFAAYDPNSGFVSADTIEGRLL